MAAMIHELTLPGAMLKRGFWLYIWRVATPEGERLYVGRTGDNSSPKAASPYQRMGQHLGNQKTQNMLRQNLERCGIEPEACNNFQLIAYGPLFPEAGDMESHCVPRNAVAALEKELAGALKKAGYQVLNVVDGHTKPDNELWIKVQDAFSDYFPKIKTLIGRKKL